MSLKVAKSGQLAAAYSTLNFFFVEETVWDWTTAMFSFGVGSAYLAQVSCSSCEGGLVMMLVTLGADILLFIFNDFLLLRFVFLLL